MRTLLAADWTDLAVITFQADKQLLAPYIPYKTELNDWNGNYYISLLGFMFSNSRIVGISSPFYRNFEEVNLRFYIRYKTKNEWENGVVFIKEIAPSTLIGSVARYLYRENFISLPMKHRFSESTGVRETEYYWKIQKQWNHLKLTTSLQPVEPPLTSLESFIRNQYRACTLHSPQKTKEFRIEHSQWNIYPGLSFNMLLDTEKIYGTRFSSCFRQKPDAYFLMDGSHTKVSYPSLL